MIIDNRRILIADDLPAIHEDYRKILVPRATTVAAVEGISEFAPHFTPPTSSALPPFQIETVMQGEDAINAVTQAHADGRPYAMVFLDVRMPPGIDGVETAERLRTIDPSLQVVLCTAYSDYSFPDISRRFRDSDSLLILKKPFDPTEVQQLAYALCRKWTLLAENKTILKTLEERVRQRTDELEKAKANLEVALYRAEAANRSKSDFVRCVSHELNTPLNGIHGAATLIELSSDPETAEMGRIMLQSSERLNRLFSRILLYLEIDPHASSERHLVSIADIIETGVVPYRGRAAQKRISLTLENTCPPRIWLKADAEKLSHAVGCLVENAVKFTNEGRVIVRLSVASDGFFYAVVEDTGPGIPEAQLAKLFESFNPGETNLNRKHEGIGIGLTLTKRISQHMGGDLQHRNQKTGGSVFTLSLPCSPA